MALAAGTRLGGYEITTLIGVGGMGEVYRARDSKLDREVAIKVLPQSVANDPERLARFEREAKTLAALNHANIAQIYGVEDSTGTSALVMELVEGPTLAERIAKRPVPIDEAAAIAKHIAASLEAAHEQGIIHRDLKPANIKVRDDGTVKILDFGLAKALEPKQPSGIDVSQSPTITTPAMMTGIGVILGTAAYMSPEQASGRIVDKRADIWAFGVVFYEMLSGRRLFEADNVPETLAAVLHQPLDWSSLPSTTPVALRQLLARCLERDSRKRLRDIGEARIALENPSWSLAGVGAAAEPTRAAEEPRLALWKRVAPLAAVGIVAAAVGALAVRYFQAIPRPPVVRFESALSGGLTLAPMQRPFLNVSRDGTQIVYVYGANRALYVRRIAERDAQVVAGTQNFGELYAPAFSPDGRAVAFWAGDGTIKRVPVEGGATVTLCRADNPYGLTWDESGIFFAQGEKATIARVSPDGGTAEVVARAKQGQLVSGPEVLPGGRFLLFAVTEGTAAEWDTARIVVHALDSTEEHTLIEGGSDAHYLAGHLVYAKEGVLLAAPFDAARAQLEGPAVPLLSGVRRGSPGLGTAHYAVSRTGTLLYVPGPAGASALINLALFDKTGKATPLKLPPGTYAHPRISPDGHHIAFTVAAGEEEFIAVYELSGTKAMRRLTLGGRSRAPIWTSNGNRVAYQTDRDGDVSIFWQAADGSGLPERLTTAAPGESHAPESWSPATDTLLYSVHKDGRYALWTTSLPEKRAASFGAVTSSVPINPVFSPDGHWVAYQSDQSGRVTVYVQPVPPTGAVYPYLPQRNDVPHEPMWSPDGKELFFNPRAGAFEVVPVTTEPKFEFGNPLALPRPFRLTPPQGRRSYDIAPDGRIVAVIWEGDIDSPAAQGLAVVLNWHEELKAKVPVPPR